LGGSKEFRRAPTVGPHPKVWTEVKNGRSSAKEGASERFRCRNQKEVLDSVDDVRRRYTVKILSQLLSQSRLFPKKLGHIDPDFLGLGEIWVNMTQFFRE